MRGKSRAEGCRHSRYFDGSERWSKARAEAGKAPASCQEQSQRHPLGRRKLVEMFGEMLTEGFDVA